MCKWMNDGDSGKQGPRKIQSFWDATSPRATARNFFQFILSRLGLDTSQGELRLILDQTRLGSIIPFPFLSHNSERSYAM